MAGSGTQRPWVALFLLLSTPGCSDEVSWDTRIMADPVGELVQLQAEDLQGLPSWRLSETPIIELGRQVSASHRFNDVSAAKKVPGVGYLVAEHSRREFRLFDLQGTSIRTWGGMGEGPGAFRTEWRRGGISPVEDGTVAVLDWDMQVTRFSLDGEWQGSGVPPRQPCVGVRARASPEGECDIVGIWVDGWMLSVRRERVPPEPRIDEFYTVPPVRLTYALVKGEEVHELQSVRSPEIVRWQGSTRTDGVYTDLWGTVALFSPEGLIAKGREGVVIVQSDMYRIMHWDRSGHPVRTIQADIRPQPVTEAILRRHRTWYDSSSVSNRHVREYLDRLAPGGVVPFFSEVRIDTIGRIWLRDYDHPIGGWGRQESAWTVFGRDGLPIARLSGPLGGRHSRILEIGRDYVLLELPVGNGMKEVSEFRLLANQ